jgi:hypothetical protein
VLDAGKDAVTTRADAGPARPGRLACGGVDVFIRGTRKEVTRFGEADGVSRTTNRILPGTLVARSGPFLAYRTTCGAVLDYLERFRSGRRR